MAGQHGHQRTVEARRPMDRRLPRFTVRARAFRGRHLLEAAALLPLGLGRHRHRRHELLLQRGQPAGECGGGAAAGAGAGAAGAGAGAGAGAASTKEKEEAAVAAAVGAPPPTKENKEPSAAAGPGHGGGRHGDGGRRHWLARKEVKGRRLWFEGYAFARMVCGLRLATGGWRRAIGRKRRHSMVLVG